MLQTQYLERSGTERYTRLQCIIYHLIPSLIFFVCFPPLSLHLNR